MTYDWRGPNGQEAAMGRLWRGRYPPGSLLVLDIDRVIVSTDLARGLVIEEKHEAANDRTWKVTREIGERLGWWSARFDYWTAGGRVYDDNVTRIDAILRNPAGKTWEYPNLSLESLDRWILRKFGNGRPT